MFVSITGGTSRQRQLLKTAVFFYDRFLFKRSTSDNISIAIKLKNIKDGNIGYCDLEYEDVIKEFIIELEKTLEDEELLVTLAHELVHTKQLAIGYFKQEIVNGCMKWKNQLISISNNVTDYPWEQEALELERKLYDRYINESKTIKE